MINNPKLIKEIIQNIENTTKEQLDRAIEEVEEQEKEQTALKSI